MKIITEIVIYRPGSYAFNNAEIDSSEKNEKMKKELEGYYESRENML